MPPRTSRPQHPGHLVTAVLVVHDGARWLPDCLAALAGQSRPPQRVVAVDTGSTDESPALLTAALGESAVVRVARGTGLGDAVQAGLDAFLGAATPPGVRGPATDWVWVLHDDCVPDADALLELLTAATESPSVAAFGPKLLDWDGRHLLELGVTVDASGDRRTGMEPLELDQGQHDDTGDVLAVSTAGLLVRRTAWDAIGGFDRAFPLYGEDTDFGWRLNELGERVRVAPRAHLRHAAALLSGDRRPDAVPGRAGAAARRHGMQGVLVNTSGWLVPWLVLRYVVEQLVRSLLLLVFARRPGAAADELLALAGVLARPDVVLAGRRRRRGRTVGHADLRGLLAPPGLRMRRFGDTIAETFAGRAAAEERRRRRAPVETGPVAAEAESLELEGSALARLLGRPWVALTLVLAVVGLVASRDVLGGTLHGGRLLPAPAGAADLWSTYTAAWHGVDLGSSTPAPPSLALLALLSTVLFGKVWLAVAVLLIGAAPLAGLSAYAASGAVTRSTRLRLWAAVLYALTPVLTGAVAGGRLDVVVAVVLLPLLLRAVAAAVRSDRAAAHRWVGAGLLLSVVVAFAPVGWLLVAAVLAVGVAARRAVRASAALAVLVVPLLVLLPWSIDVATHPRLLVAGMGLPETLASARPLGAADLLLLRPGGAAQPWPWLLAPVLLAAVVGLVRRARGRYAQAGFVVLVTGLVGALVVSRLDGPVDADPAIRYWAGVPLAFAVAGALVAAMIAAERARPVLRRHSFGWRQPAAALLAGAALAGTAGLAVTWVARGADGPLTDRPASALPVFAAAELARPTSPRILALRASDGLVRYSLVQDPDGPRLGASDVRRRGEPREADTRLADAVRSAAAGQSDAVPVLVEYGVSMLLVPDGIGPALAGLRELDGLSRVPTDDGVVFRADAPAGALVLLDPGTAETVTGGAGLPAGARPRPLPSAAGGTHATLPTGPPGRLLVLAEPAEGAWRATLDGRPLPRAQAFGWAQAWRLPAGEGALVVERSGSHRGAWLSLQLALVVVAVLAALPGRRSGRRHLGEGGTP
jgi:GT2 family glycosyltransferase